MRFILPAVLASFALASTARAESAPAADTGCFGSEVMLPATLPANAPGIPFAGAVGTVAASLLAPDGTTVADKVVLEKGFPVLVLEKELTPGTTYTVRWSDACDGMRTKSFVASAAVPFAKVAGTLTASVTRNGAFDGRCDFASRPIFTVERSVHFTASPELEPWLPVARAELLLNDVPRFASLPPGSYKPGITVGSAGNSCPGEPLTHSVVLRIFIANGPTVDTEVLVTDVACPSELPGPCRADPVPGEDPGVPEGNEQTPSGNEPERAQHYGCTASPGTTSSVGFAMIALALALATRRRP